MVTANTARRSFLFRNPVTVEQTVRRRDYTNRGRESAGYVVDQWTEQHLLETVRVFGIPVFRRVLDRETVPADVLIELGALGSTSWRSKFADVINRQRAGSR